MTKTSKPLYTVKQTLSYVVGVNPGSADWKVLMKAKDHPVYFDDAAALKRHIVATSGRESAVGGFDDNMSFIVRLSGQLPMFRNDKDARRTWTLRKVENLRVSQNAVRQEEKDTSNVNRARIMDKAETDKDAADKRVKLTNWAVEHNLRPGTGGHGSNVRFVRKQITDDTLRAEFDREFSIVSAEFCG